MGGFAYRDGCPASTSEIAQGLFKDVPFDQRQQVEQANEVKSPDAVNNGPLMGAHEFDYRQIAMADPDLAEYEQSYHQRHNGKA